METLEQQAPNVTMPDSTLANNIKNLRQQTGLSQDKLAAKADISVRHYQRIEAGENLPTVYTIFKIAHALDLPYTALLDTPWSEFLANPNQSYE